MRRLIPCLAISLVAGAVAQEQDFNSLPKKVVPSPPVVDTDPLSSEDLETSIRKGVDFLLKIQNKNGSWGGPTDTKGLNIYAPLPGAHHAFRMGTSGLALAGLVMADDPRPEAKAAIDKAEQWLIKELPKLKRPDATTTYNNWGHAYGLRAINALAQREGISAEKKAEYAKLAQEQVDALVRYQDIDGGWGYLHFDSVTQRPSGESTSFLTGTVLLAIHEAKELFGVSFPKDRLMMAMQSIHIQQTPDFSYVYAMGHRKVPRYDINRPAGSLARTPVCNAALRVWGDEKITDEVLTQGLDRLVKRNGWLDIGRKRPRPHETHFAISGYFYFYGHYYASECITMLPKEEQAEWKDKLAKILLDKQESDGSWWDYPLYSYGPPYGTGYTLAALSRCRKTQ
ncbi:Prenyltransferase and squalene oxidase repeat-containing protein [Rubritalea squalenifaciens DSM 18772]|uniref:Prenyltransferase and squalene oxidase repeat-containing protein n=1 Tax=Rubritalea squalenifaciens DSM 18772 TaxID=1123071 RepID=A0A1M6NFI3_9BACT|nr:prenyltransferase/squalene oxidase repeat-containing protein [Rubritalea squalenifaciens]SHJ94394.1 Prenyltransferase and squalene oxidase repeat-containing protein [Rubritalea squalenifaciens DSM 18772]